MMQLIDVAECVCDRCGAERTVHHYVGSEGHHRMQAHLPAGWTMYGQPGAMYCICEKHRIECVDIEPAAPDAAEPGQIVFIKPDGRRA